MSWQDRQQVKVSKAELTAELATVVAHAAQGVTPVMIGKLGIDSNTADPDVVSITNKGVLTGLSVIFRPADAAESASVTMSIVLDGVAILNGGSILSKGEIVTTNRQDTFSLSFNHPFSTSLYVSAAVLGAMSTADVFVTYTTD